MSLAINPEHVFAVLIAGVWHEVARIDDNTGRPVLERPTTFRLDPYEYVTEGNTTGGGGTMGFSFLTGGGDRISGPLTSVQAVRTKA